MKLTDAEAWILQVRARRAATGRPLSEAVLDCRILSSALAARVLEQCGSWPSSEPEIAELQRQS